HALLRSRDARTRPPPRGERDTRVRSEPPPTRRPQIGRRSACAGADGLQDPSQDLPSRRDPAYDADDFGSRRPPRRDLISTRHMNDARRGNYDSGEDFVLEYGELRFTFNERDFRERCEQAARKLGFVRSNLGEQEREDLVNLAVNGEISEPASGLGEH